MSNKPTTPVSYQCPECNWEGLMEDLNGLHHISRINDRITAGEFVPAGACPKCSALISVKDQDIPDYTLQSVAHVMRSRGWTVTEPTDLQLRNQSSPEPI
jgi:hypothetical protein